jgi:Na+/melibiose symporter-like transporter
MVMSTFSHVPRLAQKISGRENETEGGVKAIYKAFFESVKNKNLLSVVLGYSISMMASTFLIALGFHTFTFTFKTTSTQMYFLIFLLFAMTILGQPFWLRFSIRTEKKKALLAGLATALVGSGMLIVIFIFRDTLNAMLAANGATLIFMAIPLIVCGLGIGVLFSLPVALVGDTVIMNKAETNKERAGTYSGFMTLSYKLSQAISQFLIGGLLDLIGFREGSAAQTAGVEDALGKIFCAGISVSIIIGMLAFSRFNIKKEDVNAVLEKMNDA